MHVGDEEFEIIVRNNNVKQHDSLWARVKLLSSGRIATDNHRRLSVRLCLELSLNK
jgi:hypothetical protein